MREHERKMGGESTKSDLAYQLEFLKEIEEGVDYGPVADCLVWNDGTKWR